MMNFLYIEEINCGFPGYFPRGRIHGRSYLYGDEIHYSCADGYELRGNPHRICNSDGKWFGQPPICIGKRNVSLNTCKSCASITYMYILILQYT